ncbi:MAG: FCD domain-containing protein [Phycisphaerae bacterium]|nr:FCD domain-containing protein [Phycisphaerae bacterium]
MAIVRRENLNALVAERLKKLILDEGLKPGDRLPTENELAIRFGVSRVSVREATRALAFLGIIRAAPRRGLTVGELDLGRASQYLGFHFAISNYPPGVLVRARLVIETGSLPYTMEAMAENPALYTELMAHVDRMDKDSDDLDRFIDGDIAFHRALVESSGIDPLVAFTDLLHAFFRSFRENIRVAERRVGNAVHRTLITALRDRDLEKARETLRRHIEPHVRLAAGSAGR